MVILCLSCIFRLPLTLRGPSLQHSHSCIISHNNQMVLGAWGMPPLSIIVISLTLSYLCAFTTILSQCFLQMKKPTHLFKTQAKFHFLLEVLTDSIQLKVISAHTEHLEDFITFFFFFYFFENLLVLPPLVDCSILLFVYII